MTETILINDADDSTLSVFEQGWPGQAVDTVCGWGSSREHTETIRLTLPRILRDFGCRTMNDAGCGDLAWIQHVDLSDVDYVGYDAFERDSWPALRADGFKLEIADIVSDQLRDADLVLCRDVFIHLPNSMVLDALELFRSSARYLLTTSYVADPTVAGCDFDNAARLAGPSLLHAKLDLALAPFNLGEPILRIPENSPNKYTGLWCLDR